SCAILALWEVASVNTLLMVWEVSRKTTIYSPRTLLPCTAMNSPAKAPVVKTRKTNTHKVTFVTTVRDFFPRINMFSFQGHTHDYPSWTGPPFLFSPPTVFLLALWRFCL